jgi:hypothetical protein
VTCHGEIDAVDQRGSRAEYLSRHPRGEVEGAHGAVVGARVYLTRAKPVSRVFLFAQGQFTDTMGVDWVEFDARDGGL